MPAFIPHALGPAVLSLCPERRLSALGCPGRLWVTSFSPAGSGLRALLGAWLLCSSLLPPPSPWRNTAAEISCRAPLSGKSLCSKFCFLMSVLCILPLPARCSVSTSTALARCHRCWRCPGLGALQRGCGSRVGTVPQPLPRHEGLLQAGVCLCTCVLLHLLCSFNLASLFSLPE